jgi:hypothetical protein
VAREVESESSTSPEVSRKRVLPRIGRAENQSKKPRKATLTPSKQLLVTELSKISAELITGVTQLTGTLEKILALEKEKLEFARSLTANKTPFRLKAPQKKLNMAEEKLEWTEEIRECDDLHEAVTKFLTKYKVQWSHVGKV